MREGKYGGYWESFGKRWWEIKRVLYGMRGMIQTVGYWSKTWDINYSGKKDAYIVWYDVLEIYVP